jgi:hypothetical protein
MADRDELDDEPKPKPAGFSGLDGLQLVFLIAACSGAIFYVNGPAQNANQAFFRLGVMVLGGIGLLVVTIVKLTTRR